MQVQPTGTGHFANHRQPLAFEPNKPGKMRKRPDPLESAFFIAEAARTPPLSWFVVGRTLLLGATHVAMMIGVPAVGVND